ncbi:MAG: hypothetical protein H7070_10490 [Saprospiraceae bacterium]|nr:hypothetical protein [Pyrinomonadaceae bacterium]
MSENRKTKLSSISRAATLEQIGEFWDTHSLDDHWGETREADFTVRALQRRRITVDPILYQELEAEANIRGVVPETLANLWLAEKLHASK